MKKYIWLLVFALLPSVVSAHSAVSPSTTTTSKYETFTLSVPTEKDVPTAGIRLVVPAGIDRFTPFVKPGWQVKLTKDGDKVTEVEWTGGLIPNGQKDVFQFTARTGGEPTTLVWKVYQTYQNGEVVSWDQDPKSAENVSNPYSITEVQNDSTGAKAGTRQNNFIPYIISIVALVISLVALRSTKNT